MKTDVIEVRDMLSILSVLEVEKRIGDVPGVESVTVNHAAGTAAVRYDETRLFIITAEAYRAFIDANALQAPIVALAKDVTRLSEDTLHLRQEASRPTRQRVQASGR